jgi:hypothetical protein
MHEYRSMNTLRILIALTMLAGWCSEAASASTPGSIDYVGGVKSAEDIVAVPDSRWIVTSGLSHDNKSGALFLIDREKKTSSVLFSGGSIENKHDARAYPGCPNETPDASFSAHGINLRRGKNKVHTVYVINHGSREAVEVFEIDVSGNTPTLAWRGCILLPEGAVGNGVTPLAEGSIAVTLMAMPEYFAEPGASKRYEAWVEKFNAAQITGYAGRWSATTGWKKVPGTEGSGPNGIEASKDHRWLWVADWASSEVVRVSLADQTSRSVIKMDFMPDNLRWGDDGQLWASGATGSIADYFKCGATPECRNDYSIVRIDPSSLSKTPIPHPDTLPVFGDATTALKVGRDLWLASNVGTRVALMKLHH